MVHVTNDHTGLTFIDHSWVATLGGHSYTSHTSPDEVRRRHGYYIGEGEVVTEIQTSHVVPNGKWVARQQFGCNWPVGVDHDELEMLEYHDKDGIYRRLFIGDKPFGFVNMDSEDVIVYPDMVKPTGRKTLVYARQVWKGEEGRGVHIPRLDYVRQPLAPHRGLGMKARERRRGQYGWVKLADLGEMTVGYRPDKQVELVLGYWQFSGHESWQNGQKVGTLVDVAWGSSLDIELGEAEFMSLTQWQFREECDDTSEVWVRRGFAYTILRLQALGVQPEVQQPTAG